MSAQHGNTPAAWTAVSIMFVGALVAALALPFALPWMFFVGLGIVAVGAIVGKVMQMMGMGATVTYKDERDPEYATRPGEPTHPAAEQVSGDGAEADVPAEDDGAAATRE